MKMNRKTAITATLLAACGVSFADGLDGQWSARIQRDGEDVTYRVDLGRSQGRLVGAWAVDASRSSSGCLQGGKGRAAVPFRTCTLDGSAGSRDLDAVCPSFHADQNRFVLRGSQLAWEVRDARQASWRVLVHLERNAKAAPGVIGDDARRCAATVPPP